jgi:tRNA(fMet)-specific endonuclease VapC
MYMLDTNTVSYFFKGKGRVGERLLAVPPHRVSIPAVVLYEIESGIRKSPEARVRRRQLAALVSAVTVAPFGKNEAASAAEIRVALEGRGTPIRPYDVLIAGTALANKAILVTHNTKEFGRIPGIVLEDWY